MPKTPCTIEHLHSILRLDEETGHLYWRERPVEHMASLRSALSFNARFAGNRALNSAHSGGYLCGAINGIAILAHRVVYAMHSNEWPNGEVDHINGDRADNRPCNLRAVTRSENSRNAKLGSRNSSGRIGVSYLERDRKWRAGIFHQGKQVWLGLYKTFEEACDARAEAEMAAGYHPNHGRIAA